MADKKYEVRVREDYRWPVVRIADREFSKSVVVLAEHEMNDEIRRAGGKGYLILDIREVAAPAAKAKKPRSRKPRTTGGTG